MFVRVGGNIPKWPDISVDDDIWSVQYLYKLFLIPDDGVSSIDSDHLGVLDNRFVTAFLACRRDVISMLGLGLSILLKILYIENLAVLILLSLCQLLSIFENLGSGNSSEFICPALMWPIWIFWNWSKGPPGPIKGADPQQTYSDVSIIKVATPTLEQISLLVW